MLQSSDAQRIPLPPKQVCGAGLWSPLRNRRKVRRLRRRVLASHCLRRSEIQTGVKTMKFPKLVAAMLMAGGAFLYAAPESQALEMFGAPGIGGLHDDVIAVRGGGRGGGGMRHGGGGFAGGGHRGGGFAGGGRYGGGGYRGGGGRYAGGGYR